jgi:hypothetical protein
LLSDYQKTQNPNPLWLSLFLMTFILPWATLFKLLMIDGVM